MAESNGAASASTGGVGFLALLGLLFIGLKLGGCIDWGWHWVLLPLYGPPALLLAFVVLFVLFACLMHGLQALINR